MTHSMECPKCGTIGEWNWEPKRKRLLMPNGEYVFAKVAKKLSVKCPECKHEYQNLAEKTALEGIRRISTLGGMKLE